MGFWKNWVCMLIQMVGRTFGRKQHMVVNGECSPQYHRSQVLGHFGIRKGHFDSSPCEVSQINHASVSGQLHKVYTCWHCTPCRAGVFPVEVELARNLCEIANLYLKLDT